MKTPHLVATLAATILLALALFVGTRYAEQIENRYLNALAPMVFEQKSHGVALARAAFSRPDVLPLYGSSELRGGGPYAAGKFFQTAPSGFVVFPIGLHAANNLIYLQQIASLGPAIRGKKVVLSLSPGFFLLPQLDAPAYGFNFSHLHACELAFSSDLSRELKRDAAKRMRRYPATLKDDRVLDYALKGLAEDSPLSTFGYFLALPLGKLQCQVLELQDHWATLEYIREQPGLEPDVPHATVSLDWTALAADGDRRARAAVTNNQFGIADDYWVLSGATWLRQKNTLSDQVFTNKLNSSREWIDLELVLRELAELGAQPLVLSQPFHGMYYDFMGVSPRARSQYYDRLEKLAKKYGVSLVDYREYEQDKYFPEDPLGHMSPKGWLLFDQAINTFYHAAAH